MKGSGNNFFGKKHTDEAKRKISEKNSGYRRTEEHKKLISSLFLGVPKSEDHKSKIIPAKQFVFTKVNYHYIIRLYGLTHMQHHY